MPVFTVELAGIPVKIQCRYPDNESFFRDYLTDREPLLTISPSEADLIRTQACFDRVDDAKNIPRRRIDPAFLENNAIHSALAEALTEYGVILLHGSALSIDGQGVVFVASSGTGKSTHARLWRQMYGNRVFMINDDKPLIRITDGQAFIYGTPWNGKHGLSRNASAPLKAVVSLERDSSNHIGPMSRQDAYPLLIKHAYRTSNPLLMSRILDLEDRLLGAASFLRLGCNTDPEAALVAYNGIFA